MTALQMITAKGISESIRNRFSDLARNLLYPLAIVLVVTIIWVIGWASSQEARANVGYWQALREPISSSDVTVDAAAVQSAPATVSVIEKTDTAGPSNQSAFSARVGSSSKPVPLALVSHSRD